MTCDIVVTLRRFSGRAAVRVSGESAGQEVFSVVRRQGFEPRTR
jgi:hypothetical protein